MAAKGESGTRDASFLETLLKTTKVDEKRQLEIGWDMAFFPVAAGDMIWYNITRITNK